MWPAAPTALSQPQPCITAVHCGELISMKDCGLWATMTCKLSSNFFLALSPPLCLRHCREGAVTGALKCSPSDQQLRGAGRRKGRGGEERRMWVSPWPTACLWICACLFVFRAREGWHGEKSDWLLSFMSITALLLTLSSLFPLLCAPPGLVSAQCGLQLCGVLLLTNQTSQCHWAALSKTHGHVSSLHSPAFQRLAGSLAKER